MEASEGVAPTEQAEAMSSGLEPCATSRVRGPLRGLADYDLLAPYQIKKVRGDLPAGFDGALTDELMGKRVDFAVRVDFLSEVFVDDKPLSRPVFEGAATPLPGAGDVMALEVLAPRLGRGTLLRRGRAGMFISRTPDLPIPSALLERLVE